MSVAIYSKAAVDKWEYYNEIGILSDEIKGKSLSTSSEYYGKYVSPNSISTLYSIWNLPHSIIFDCYEGDKSTFNRDDFGFIPPHILIEITNSKEFKRKFDQLKSEYEDEFKGLNEDEDSADYFEPNDNKLEELSPIIEIIDFIVKNKNNGICWS
jgi:hypothetical protein